ncbi:MAG: NF038122 family metalloprotease [Cyanobacteria bacterium J06649_5]
MVQFNLTYDQNISLEQRVAYQVAANILKRFLTDDTVVDIHFVGTSGLNGGNAVGGAIPIFHTVNYGILSEYLAQDASSYIDDQSVMHLQDGNTIDLSAYGEIIDGNTEINLTTAQAEALGMDKALFLSNGAVWDRDVLDTTGLDGYILVNQDFEWNNDVLRTEPAAEGTLDSLSMALHEMLHIMGFVSGIDGTIEYNQLFSGDTQVEGATLLDLFRHSAESTTIENPDGSVSTITEGEAAYLSADGGVTNLGDFATGQNTGVGGDGYQASHWKRMQVALGIMDPTLAYQERLSIAERDLQALDLLGWDIDYSALDTGLDMTALLLQAEQTVAEDLGLDSTILTEHRASGSAYTMGFSEWWALFEDQIVEMGFSEWWQVLEVGYNEWITQQEDSDALLQMGFSEWWQSFEATIIELGFSEWWQSFEADMLNMGFSEWWQVLEMGFSEWWQQLETYFSTFEKAERKDIKDNKKADGGIGGKNAKVYKGGKEDDIITGDAKQDRINAGKGDDLIDGKGGHDVIWGDAGKDIIYGQKGNDLIYGGDDDDLLLGEADDDELHGEAGHDIVSGGSGDDVVTGGEGRDDLKGGWGNDVLDGGEGNDRLEGEADSDILIGGKGKDQLSGGGGDDVLYGDTYEGTETLRQLRAQLQARVKENEESSEGTDTAPPNTTHNGPIRVEAESMTLTGDAYIHTTWNNDSGDSVKTTGSSTATTTFSGQSGSYLVVMRYFDEIEGDGRLTFSLNGTSLNSFDLNQNTDRYYTRTIAQNLTLNTGDEVTITATGDEADEAAFDYLEFIPLDNLIETSLEQSSSNSTLITTTSSSDSLVSLLTATTESVFRVEAESMTLVGDYYTEANNSASGGNLIAVSNQGEGKALSTFSGESGYYNIVVGYYDESGDGIAKISTSLSGTELDTWWLDQSLDGGTTASAQNFTTRTVASTIFLQSGELFELTGLRGEGNEDELARIDYVDFVKVNWATDGNTDTNEPIESGPSTPVIVGEAIRIEAESMNLNGYFVESNSNPSGGQLLRTNSSGIATTQFLGEAGYYNIVIAYYDENDGLATISASLGGVELDEWQLDQDLGSNFISSTNRVTRTIGTQIKINTGDELRLEGIREYNEYARIDYVEFVPVSAPVTAVIETINDDFLQGGAGNDTVYGGEGNDILYGESQGDNTSSLLKGAKTYNGHTYLLSDLGSWEETQLQAQQLGGNLVTINDAEEESWVRNTFSASERLWTGMNDITAEGQFEWVSGESITYTNFVSGEPNGINSTDENYVTMNFWGTGWADDYGHGAWEWNGSDWVGLNGLRGIIEIDTTDNDTLVGGSDHDTLYGNGGDDALYGDTLNSSPGSNPLSNGLVGHWELDEISGLQAEDVTGGNTGILTNVNTPRWNSSGAVGGALEFGGVDDHILVADSAELDITQTLTLATWVNADAFENWTGLIIKGTSNVSYALELGSDGKLIFDTNYGNLAGASGQGTFYSSSGLTINQWHHVAVTYDGNNVQFYIDGQLDSSTAASITLGTSNEELVIGADLAGGSHFNGDLDDVRVYNRALSAEELAQLSAGEGGVSASSEGGSDFLYGGVGSDTLEGGGGNDVLDGSDAIAAGHYETDVLTGGLGADTFVIGNGSQTYYLGGNDKDFALIKDFNAVEDIVQLHGSAGDYMQYQQGNDTYLSYQGNTSDLVAVFENVDRIDFDQGFAFV